MSFGVENPFIQANEAGISEDQVRVLHGLSKEETLLEVRLSGIAGIINVIQACETTVCAAVLVDGIEDGVSLILPGSISSQTIEIE
jgi:hypothetical protein